SSPLLRLARRRRFCAFHSFFFRAEDGIRAFHVTGVQTCALPISRSAGSMLELGSKVREIAFSDYAVSVRATSTFPMLAVNVSPRSEERRVGRESRMRWAAGQSKIHAKLWADRGSRKELDQARESV